MVCATSHQVLTRSGLTVEPTTRQVRLTTQISSILFMIETVPVAASLCSDTPWPDGSL